MLYFFLTFKYLENVFWKPRMGSSLPRDGLHVESDVGVGGDDWRAILVGKKWS